MTERLSALLHEEAASVNVPPPPLDSVVHSGRRLRRRRRLAYGAAGIALVTVVGTGAAVSLGGRGDDGKTVDPAESTAGLQGATFSVGVTVYLDGGATHATINDKAIKSSYYTSAGLLVRHGNNNASDGGGPQRFSLVTPEGTVRPVSVVTEESVPGVDPTQPYLAYTEVVDDVVEVVVHDVATDEEVARVPVPDAHLWGGWSGPPVALSGDIVYVGTDDVMRTVDWRTGEIGETDTLAPGYPDVRGGRTIVSTKPNESSILDAASGETVLTVPSTNVALSPDGRFATAYSPDGSILDVYDVAEGTHVTVDDEFFIYGWTPEGDLSGLLDDRHVVTCSSDSGVCRRGAEAIPVQGGGVEPRDVRFAGQTFES